MDLTSYFDMGGYAAYVWPAYLVTAVVMAALLLSSWLGLRAREAELAALQHLNPRRRVASPSPAAPSPADGESST